MSGVSLHKHLQRILEEKMLPAVRGGTSVTLLQPPLFTTGQDRLETVCVPAAPLPKVRQERSHIALHLWPEEFLNSLRVPYLACVFEGEADIVTALTTEQARNRKGVMPLGRQIVSLPATRFFLVPPGAPVSYGTRPHWERECPENAYSRIFWIHLVPSGAFCHTCISSKGQHSTHPFIFVAGEQIAALSHLLVAELLQRQEGQSELVHSLLLSLLLKLSNGLGQESPTLLATGESMEAAAALRPETLPSSNRPNRPQSDSVIVRRALKFMEANLNQVLTPTLVAERSYVSVSHLHRLFQNELDTSVMEYIVLLRLNKARSLLTETDMSITEVGVLCGYSNASHFSRLFARHEGLSPREFRKLHQNLAVTAGSTP
jgi:AraC-like DNA-binding protein